MDWIWAKREGYCKDFTNEDLKAGLCKQPGPAIDFYMRNRVLVFGAIPLAIGIIYTLSRPNAKY